MSVSDIINIGLSEAGNDKLDELKELGVFSDKIDGYRFAVGLAIAQGASPPEVATRKTFLNVGSLDPDQAIRCAVEALFAKELLDTTVYRLVERLADWGVNELYAQAKAGEIDFPGLLKQVAQKVE